MNGDALEESGTSMSAERRHRRSRGGSLATKLSGAFILTALLSVVLVGVLIVGLLRLNSAEIAIADLRRQADLIAAEPRLVERDQTPPQTLRVLIRALRLSDAAIYRITPPGDLALVTGSETVPPSQLDASALLSGRTLSGRVEGQPGLVFVARPVGARGRNVLVLSRRAALAAAPFAPLASRLLVAAVLAMGLAAIVALVLARRISRPMIQLADAASALARGEFGRRVAVDNGGEIGVVAESFNRMAAELGDSDRRQREFFLSISHELRTPLTAIQGYAEAIEDGTASGSRGKEAASVIVGQSRRLTRLVSDVLDLARFDARRFEVSLDTVEVEPVLLSVRQAFAPKADEAGVRLMVSGEHANAIADYDRLVQVLSNLVENALRYTPARKSISLSCSSGGGWTEIRVTDGGLGFSQDDLQRAFDRQYLWQKYRGERDVGTGLGLAITRELVQAMGGSVRAQNSPDGGAEFIVRLRQSN